MIESVHLRHLGSHDFHTIYTQLCALQDTCPLTSVKAHLSEGALDLNVDRIRHPDWAPILNSLRINKNLQKVALKSYYQSALKPEGKFKVGHKHKPSQKLPPILSKDVTHKMCISLRECLQVTESLEDLSLQGIPLRQYGMQNIAKGLSKTLTLQQLSLEYCRLGNVSVELLCQAIQTSPSLKSLNLTGCGLTKTGAEAIAKLIKHQSTSRHSEAWKDSLRYRRPNLDQMPGLRRITLNNNPLINDSGAISIADALKDDLWLKALDMQHCGISNDGGAAILEALQGNTTIVVLDIRRNPLIDHGLLKSVIEQVLINGEGREEEYPWLVATTPDTVQKAPSRVKKKRNIKKKENKLSPSQRSSQGRSTVTVHKESHPITKPGPGFVPWRSAARAEERQRSATNVASSSHINKPERLQAPPKPTSSVRVHKSPATNATPSTKMGSSVLVEESASSQSEDETTAKDESISTASELMKKRKEERNYKELLVQLEELKRRVDLETRARAMADAQILELTLENSRLKRHIQLLEGNGPLAALKKTREQMKDNGKASGLDEDLLQTIEQSFQKFHSFLDLLRDAGLGQLCSLVGLSPTELQNPAVASILKNHQPTRMVSIGMNDRAVEASQVSTTQNGRVQFQFLTTQSEQVVVPEGYMVVSNGESRPQLSVFEPSIVNGTKDHIGWKTPGSVKGGGLVLSTDPLVTGSTNPSVPHKVPRSVQPATSRIDGGEGSGIAAGIVTAYETLSGECDSVQNNSNSSKSHSKIDIPRNNGTESDRIVLEDGIDRRRDDNHGDTQGYGEYQRGRCANGSTRHLAGAGDFVTKDTHLITPQDLMASNRPDESGSFRVLPAEDASVPMVQQVEEASLPVISQAEGDVLQESIDSNLELSKDGFDHSNVRTSTPEMTASSHHSGEVSFGDASELPSQVELGRDDSS